MSWAKKTLGELCTIQKGKIGIKKATPGEFPLVVTAEDRLSHNEFHFEGNAVIIPLVSSTGHGHKSLNRIHFQSGRFAVGNILCAVIPKDENVLRADYLYRFLDLNREKELVSRMKGMANVTLPMKEIAKIEIPIPPIKAQIDFVQQYTVLEEKSNDLGEEITQQLDFIKQLRQAFLREAIQGKLLPQDHNDEHAEVLLETIKAEKDRLIKEKKIKKPKPLPPITADEIPFEIPANWAYARLGELFEIQRGSSPRPKGDPRYFSKSKTSYHWITISDLTAYANGTPLSNTKEFLTKEGINHSRFVTPLDIIVVASGSAGRSSLLNIEGYIYDGLMAVKNIVNKTLKEYLFKLFQYFETDMLNQATGAIWRNINTEKLNKLIIPLPPIEEQERIVVKLDELKTYCDELEASIMESQQQNELLLQQVLREALEPKSAILS